MNRNNVLILFIFIVIFPACQEERDKPAGNLNQPLNIIFILADDLGYGDLGCYGQEVIRTPNIDKLAAEGMKFTDFYAGNTVCAPSRCALMTGRHMGHALVRANSTVPLREKDSTLAQLFKAKGYQTGMFGKWGLGEFGSTGTPEKKGFDSFMGFLNQMDAHKYYFDSMEVVKDGLLERTAIDSNRYTHDILMEAAFEFIRTHADDPFFLYLPVTIPHAELLLPRDDMIPYLDEQGNSLFDETPFEGNWLYRAQDKPMAAFASMITRLDKDIGRLVTLLEEQGVRENTILFFTSDNGPHAEGGINPDDFNSFGPFRGFKRDLYEGGIRVPMIVNGPGIPSGTLNTTQGALWDMVPTFIEMLNIQSGMDHDGTSLWAAMLDPAANPDRPPLYWEHYVSWEKEFTQAVREGPWKALRTGTEGQPVKLELFNLENDMGEKNNLAHVNPEKMDAMIRLMESASAKPENDTFLYYKDVFNQ